MYAGHGVKHYSKLGVAEFFIEAAPLHLGDKLLITGPTTGAIYLTPDEFRVDLKPIDTVPQGVAVSFKVPSKIRPSDKLFIIQPTTQEQSC